VCTPKSSKLGVIFVEISCWVNNRLWAHGARSFRGGNCVSHSEQADAKVGRGFVVKALA
jgi:hypothetical protein